MATLSPRSTFDLSRHQSLGYHAEASCVIAGGVNSNVRLLGQTPPLCFARARGAHLTDLDGNDYIDYALGMGPAILGHAPQVIIDAVTQSLDQGQLYGGQSHLELELARRLRDRVPGAELVRLGTTGTEMVQTAVRVARAATGRRRFVKFTGHYHGWVDNILTNEVTFFDGPPARIESAQPQTGGQAPGALAETVVLPWNDLSVVRAYATKFGAETAAIIMEPVLCNTCVIPPAPGYLEGVRQLCDEHGIVFIIDEVITGFRLGLRGAQGLLGVTGDLSVFAKAMGGGAPIAALAGRASLMSLIGSGAVNNSGTYNSNLMAVSAAIATLDTLAEREGAAYTKISAIGHALMDGMRDIARQSGDNLVVQGFPSVFNTMFGGPPSVTSVDEYRRCDEARQKRFLGALLERGVRPMARGTWFVSTAHTDVEVKNTLAVMREALEVSR
jgi:glutamate-1-semialdehyde 2,1-aminomutase